MTVLIESDVDTLYRHVVSTDAVHDVAKLLRLAREGGTVTHLVPEHAGRRSLLDLEGLGREIWEGVDPKQYVTRLRDEWDAR